MATPKTPWGFMVVTLILAFVLQLVVLPDFLAFWRPEWLALVMLYWLMQIPNYIGVVFAWSLGVILDLLLGSLVGSSGFALALMAFLVLTMHQRLKMFPLAQMCFMVFVLVGIELMVRQWIKSVTGTNTLGLEFLKSALTSALVWPFLLVLLRRVQYVR